MEIDAYYDLVLQCLSLSKDLESYRYSIAENNTKLSNLQLEYSQKIQSIHSNKESYIESQISASISLKTSDMKSQRDNISYELNKLQNEMFNPDMHSIVEFYRDYIELFQTAQTYIDEKELGHSELLSVLQVRSDKNMPVVLDDMYDYLEQQLNSLQDSCKTLKRPGVSKLASAIVKVHSWGKLVPRAGRLIYYFALYGSIFICAYVNPFLIAAPIAGVAVWHVAYHIDSVHDYMGALMNIKLSKTVCDHMRDIVNEAINRSVQMQESKYTKERFESVTKLQQELSQINSNISETVNGVREKITTSASAQGYEQEQKDSITREYEPRLEEIKSFIRDLVNEYDTTKVSYDELTNRRNLAKKELEDRYLSLSCCGTGKILPTRFLLGFDDFEPITLAMPNYNANIVSTVKKSKTIFTSFVSMCVAQIFCMMDPSCVQIYLSDLDNGTSRFGLFGSLSEAVHILKTDQELTNTIQKLYDIKSDRDSSIMRKNDDINKYNQSRINSFGVTLEYHILILTHPTNSVLSNPFYTQLLSSGNVGISIISLWDKTLFDSNEDAGCDLLHNKAVYLDSLLEMCDAPLDSDTSLFALSPEGVLQPMKRLEVSEKSKQLQIAANRAKKK